MAIIDATAWQAATNQTAAGTALTALEWACASVDALVKRAVLPFLPEPQTVTNAVLDAPPVNELQLPYRPVRSITSLYLNTSANGDPAQFTSDYLLTNYTDYYLPVDPVAGYNRAGVVLRRGASTWGREYHRLPDRLADSSYAVPGAIQVTFAAGTLSVPDDLFAAAMLAVSLLLKRKEFGMIAASESWNGYSPSWAGPFLTSVLESPDVSALLRPYQTIQFAAG